MKRYAYVVGVFVLWVVAYAAFPQWRSELSAVGLILGVALYLTAIPVSLFSARDVVAQQASDTVGGLLVLLALVLVNFLLLAVLSMLWQKSRDTEE